MATQNANDESPTAGDGAEEEQREGDIEQKEENIAQEEIEDMEMQAMEEEPDNDADDDDESYEEKKPRAAARGKRKRGSSGSGSDGSDDGGDDDGSRSDGSDTRDDGDGDNDEGDRSGKKKAPKKQPGPVISNGVIDLPLGPVKERLTCPLCKGYFREPFTIAECLHTFCKSCLFFGFRNGYRRCPTCDTSLEPDPYRECLADRTLESIVDKLFPHLKEVDEREEREFYARRGIKLKKEFAEDRGGRADGGGSGKGAATKGKGGKAEGEGGGKAPKRDGAGRIATKDDEMDFRLIPDENVERDYQMPPLEMSFLRASGHLKVAAIKKFLLMRLQLKASPLSVEICCNGDPLGDELSLTFIHRTRWMHPQSELVLTFRFGEEGMY